MNSGYVKLWRKVKDSGMNYAQLGVWSHCLTQAAYSERHVTVSGQRVLLAPGEFIYGRNAWMKELDIPERVLRNTVKKLREWGMIRSSTESSKFTVFSIVNWDTYQGNSMDEVQQNVHQTSIKGPSDVHQASTSKALSIKQVQENIPPTLSGPEGVKQQEDTKQPTAPAKVKPSPRCYMDHRPKACAADQWKKYFAFSWRFHKQRQATLGNRAPFTAKKALDGAKTLDNLCRVRGIASKEVQAVLCWAIEDSFWNEQVRALSSLTKIGGNGDTKYSNILTAMARSIAP